MPALTAVAFAVSLMRFKTLSLTRYKGIFLNSVGFGVKGDELPFVVDVGKVVGGIGTPHLKPLPGKCSKNCL